MSQRLGVGPKYQEYIEEKHVIRDDTIPLRIVIDMDVYGGKGIVVIEECSYGLVVSFPEKVEGDAAMIDLYYASDEHKENVDLVETGPPQFLVSSPSQTADPVGRVRFFPEGTVIDFELGVEEFKLKDSSMGFEETVYGYPRESNEEE